MSNGSQMANTGLIALLLLVTAVAGVFTLLMAMNPYSETLGLVMTTGLALQAVCLVTGIVIVVRRRPAWWEGGYVGLVIFIIVIPFVADWVYQGL